MRACAVCRCPWLTQCREVEQDEKPGGSIADRVRALQDHGLSVGPAKRISREVANLPTPPISPSRAPAAPPPPSPHTLVSPAAFGPPSPSSSSPTSPQIDISSFNQTFPSIEELDEASHLSFPSVPTGLPSDTSKSVVNKARDSFRDYAIQIERPSSTPIPAISSTFSSRPASPKPSNLSSSSSAPKAPLPVKNSALPQELLNYIRDYNVLLIDVRTREAFTQEHIKASAIICIEPTVLTRAG